MSTSDSKYQQFYKKREARKEEARIVRKYVLIVLSAFILLTIAGVVSGYIYITSALEPVDPKDKAIKDVNIPINSSVTTIASILEKNGIINNATVFRYYVKYKNESGFQAGDYKLSPSMKIEDIIASLKTGKILADPLFKITVPEGKQLPEIAELIAAKTKDKPENVLKKMNDKDYLKKLIALYPTVLSEDIFNGEIRYPLEGYLFPATYSFYEEKPSIESVIELMLDKTEEILTKHELTEAVSGFSTHQLLTMASLIEQEATEKAERKKIASVFYNRLKIKMPLQTDPTVLYALGKHKEKVYYKDLEVDNPYNTYKNAGLPPGPIASPGEMSIEAALHPEQTEYLYFLATPKGDVIFTKTLEEHNQQKNTHLK